MKYLSPVASRASMLSASVLNMLDRATRVLVEEHLEGLRMDFSKRLWNNMTTCGSNDGVMRWDRNDPGPVSPEEASKRRIADAEWPEKNRRAIEERRLEDSAHARQRDKDGRVPDPKHSSQYLQWLSEQGEYGGTEPSGVSAAPSYSPPTPPRAARIVQKYSGRPIVTPPEPTPAAVDS